MGGEDGGDVNATLTAEWESHSGKPFVKVSNNGAGTIVENKFTEKPGDEVAEDDGLICFRVCGRGGDASDVPEISFPLVKMVILRSSIKEKDTRGACEEDKEISCQYDDT